MSKDVLKTIYGLLVCMMLLLVCMYLVFKEASRNSERIMLLSQRVSELETELVSYKEG